MGNITLSLTNKQRRWIDEYLIDFNGAAAAVRTGYSAKCARSIASENLSKPDIQAVLRERQGVLASRLQIRQVDVVKAFIEAGELAKAQCNAAGMVAAWRQVGLILGLYEPETKKVELSAAQSDVERRISALTDQQLFELVAAA